MHSGKAVHLGLHLTVADNGKINLVRGTDVEDLDWSRISGVFGARTSRSSSGEFLALEPIQFESRSSWLEIWKQEGHELTWDVSIPALLKTIREATETFKTLLLSDPTRHQGKVVEIPGLMRKLTAEQVENILCLLDMPNGSNFSVPGAGKTLTTLCVWTKLRGADLVDKMIVVCPRSAFEAWEWELANSFSTTVRNERYRGDMVDPLTDFLLVNFEQLENPVKLARIEGFARNRRAHVVIDEAHRIKGGGRSVRWRACRSLSQHSSRVDILTGTPMPNSPSDLESLFSVTWPNLAKKQLQSDVLARMKRKTSFVRTTKEELKLPPVKLHTIVGEPTPIHKEVLSALRDSYAGLFSLSVAEGRAIASKGRAVMTMLAATSNPGLLVTKEFNDIEFGFSWPPLEIQGDERLGTLIHEYLKYEEPWKFRYIVDHVARLSAEGRKVVVWSSFVGNIAALKRYLTKFQPAVVYGGTAAELREQEIMRFRTDDSCTVLLTNPQTLGEGISLHMECNDAIYLDRTYNAGLYLQSLDRIHRLGLPPETETNVTFLMTESSIDERVAKRLAVKISNLSKFLDDQSLVAASIPTADEITAEEALGLTSDDLADVYSYIVAK
jgi:SNF2 family DNA or RNA helicase